MSGFVDEAQLHAKAGDGGAGAVSFRREAHVARGGPDGGDGVHHRLRRRIENIHYDRGQLMWANVAIAEAPRYLAEHANPGVGSQPRLYWGAKDLDYTINNPITLRGLPSVPARRAPEHGEHNADILAELGFGTDDIGELQASGAIPVAAEVETVR